MKKMLLLASFAILAFVGTISFAEDPAPAVISQTEISSQAAKMRNLIPEKAILAGCVNGKELLNSKLMSLLLAGRGIDLDQKLNELGMKREDCAGSSIFYAKMDPAKEPAASPAFEVGGVALFCKNESEKNLTIFEEYVKKELKKDAEAAKVTEIKEIKIQEKSALVIREKNNQMALCLIASSPNCIQFRLFFGKEPVLDLIPARGELTPIAAQLNVDAMLSLSADVDVIRKMDPVEDPTLKTIHQASIAFSEKNDLLNVLAIITSDLESAQNMKTLVDAQIQNLQADPLLGTMLKSVQTKMDGVDLRISASVPVAVVAELATKSMTTSAAPAATAPANGTESTEVKSNQTKK